MSVIRNPARSRPLSRNVKRLMKMAREAPQNPNVAKIEREFTERDLAYCDMQGSIFMAAVDRGLPMNEFAPVFMNSQLAGVIDYSFSCAGGMEEDDISNYLRMPVLLKSPSVIVDTVMWLHKIVSGIDPGESANLAIVKALSDDSDPSPQARDSPPWDTGDVDIAKLADDYEYAYWLGFIYRYESLLHEEASRMVYAVLEESFMRETFEQMDFYDINLSDCAGEICQRLDQLILSKL